MLRVTVSVPVMLTAVAMLVLAIAALLGFEPVAVVVLAVYYAVYAAIAVERHTPRAMLSAMPVYNLVVLVMLASGGFLVKVVPQLSQTVFLDQQVWSTAVVTVNLAALLAFNVGFFGARRSVLYRGTVSPAGGLVWTLIVFMGTGLVLNAYALLTAGVPLLDPLVQKGALWSPSAFLNVLLVLTYTIPVICPFLIRHSPDRTIRRVGILLLIGYLVWALLLTSRNSLLLGVLALPLAFGIKLKRGAIARVVLATLVIAALLMTAGVYRGAIGLTGSVRQAYIADRMAYSLFGNQYEKLVLDRMATDPGIRGRFQTGLPGSLTFSGFLQLLPGKQESDDLVLRRELYGVANVRTGLATPLHTVLILDFGYAGMLIGMALVGFFSAMSTNTAIRGGTFEGGLHVYWLWLLVVKTIYANLFSRVDVIVMAVFLFCVIAASRSQHLVGADGAQGEPI